MARGRYGRAVGSVGWPDGDASCEDMDGRASERGFGSRVGEGGGEGEEVVV